MGTYFLLADTTMVHLLTADFVLSRGLLLAGYDKRRRDLNKISRKTAVRRFKSFYGSVPIVYAQIYEDLQTTDIEDAHVEPKDLKFDYLMLAMYFLKTYPTEEQMAATFNIDEGTARVWTWYYLRKIQALKAAKIVWPAEWDSADCDIVYLMSVDGVHCRVQEPKHPLWSKNPKYYSHKFKQAALCYELAVSVYHNKLVWMNGPFPAGKPDITIFREEGGLKDKIPDGKRVIGDKGYRGEKDIMALPNAHDTEEVRMFKGRARARQEGFNAKVKNFNALEHRFRHKIEKHQTAFEAACVICQYQLENGSALFDA